MKKHTHKNGVTLVELMVSMVAASILILIVSLILVMAFQSWRINNAYVDLRRDSALAIYRMARDVRESTFRDKTPEYLIDGTDYLSVESAVDNSITTYRRTGSTLTRGAMLIIPKNVQSFRSLKINDGVLLTLELANNEFGIVITNQVFVNTRN